MWILDAYAFSGGGFLIPGFTPPTKTALRRKEIWIVASCCIQNSWCFTSSIGSFFLHAFLLCLSLGGQDEAGRMVGSLRALPKSKVGISFYVTGGKNGMNNRKRHRFNKRNHENPEKNRLKSSLSGIPWKPVNLEWLWRIVGTSLPMNFRTTLQSNLGKHHIHCL